jgi:hypothetical protein
MRGPPQEQGERAMVDQGDDRLAESFPTYA